MKFIKLFFSIIIGFSVLVSYGQNRGNIEKGFYEVSEEQVVKLLKVLPELRNAFKGKNENFAPKVILIVLKKVPKIKFANLARSSGFKDENEFINVADATEVYSVLKLKKLEVKLENSIKELLVKTQLLIKSQLKAVKKHLYLFEGKISKSSIVVVKKHYDVIDKIFSNGKE